MTVSVALYTPGIASGTPSKAEYVPRATLHALRTPHIPFRHSDRQSGDTSECFFSFGDGADGATGIAGVAALAVGFGAVAEAVGYAAELFNY